jgi:hypothetical protein
MEELPAETSADAETFLREQSQGVKASEPHP